ncbi:Metallo-dependent phosphatase-like protein [Fimicolochytrium jonesii]|uniref:Metallo-dependent phosphatase-like protein n=1 Tax=Fimicolochytrium jonesii TaxID=1396493 RepID=UPI0022FF1B3C|nr:Metallo-dependent phosphatase-like protein [Fimicolochytrium jonesii]KAI8821004.1 Metallo-dependent phosphatase-like protein [Fimicolochytrium jonesii]
MVRLGILADTHIPKRSKEIPPTLLTHFQSVDMILHAGDWASYESYTMLQQLFPNTEIIGVAGNNDDARIRHHFGSAAKVIAVSGVKIGLVHGHEGKSSHTTEQRAFHALEHERVDVVVYGHSHVPSDRIVDGVRMFNPGSPTDKRRQARYSFGVMDVGLDGSVHLEHVYFDRMKEGSSENATVELMEMQRPRKRRCTQCQQEGHNRRTCSSLRSTSSVVDDH